MTQTYKQTSLKGAEREREKAVGGKGRLPESPTTQAPAYIRSPSFHDICVSGVITHLCQKARPRRVDSLDSANNIDLDDFLCLKAQ
ncbi:unnamed protein product [Hymenolepis diminuta]|uniref:Uncharacterized protein n=1 Tax=Hymenolepis diminuta TaxID=6216 RepID=A0A564YYQ2_HYMDI|nr:unnamed protein product [Hymenolepis diminuta]